MLEKFLENWLLKVLALIFALILWFFVMGERRLEVGYTVPLELKNIPEAMMVANEVPSLVDVRISGPRTLLTNLRPTDLSIAVDLKGLKPGITTFRRLEERINIPSALKVTRVSPSYVDIKLDRIKEKTLPVRVVTEGEPAPGYRLVRIEAEPARVTVEGAESELKDLVEVTAEPVSLDGVHESFTLMVPLAYKGKYSKLKEDQAVEVKVTIGAAPAARGRSSRP